MQITLRQHNKCWKWVATALKNVRKCMCILNLISAIYFKRSLFTSQKKSGKLVPCKQNKDENTEWNISQLISVILQWIQNLIWYKRSLPNVKRAPCSVDNCGDNSLYRCKITIWAYVLTTLHDIVKDFFRKTVSERRSQTTFCTY